MKKDEMKILVSSWPNSNPDAGGTVQYTDCDVAYKSLHG